MRPSWDEYFLRIAELIATRATCDRKHVGAVLVKDRRIVSTGYNGAPRGLPHCDDAGHELKQIEGRESCVRTLHAESNALDQAGTLAEGATLYVTVIPCYDCAKRIVNAGIVRVVYGEYYASRNTELVQPYFKEAGVGVESGLLGPTKDEELRLRGRAALSALFSLRDKYRSVFHQTVDVLGGTDSSLARLIQELDEIISIMNRKNR